MKDLKSKLSAPSPVLCWVPSGHPNLSLLMPGLPHSPLPLNLYSCLLSTEPEILQPMGADWAWPNSCPVMRVVSQGCLAWHLGPLTSALSSASGVLCNLEKLFPSLGFSFPKWKTTSTVPLQDVCSSCRNAAVLVQSWRDQQCLLQHCSREGKIGNKLIIYQMIVTNKDNGGEALYTDMEIDEKTWKDTLLNARSKRWDCVYIAQSYLFK